MKNNKIVVFMITLLLLIVPGIQAKAAESFIIDTDFSSDLDDALAVSLAMYYQDQGLIDVKGVALECTSIRGAWAMNALLQAHGHPEIPVAVDSEWGIPIGSKYHFNMSNYRHNEDYYYGTVQFYRKLLSQSTTPINIVTLGQVITLRRLLESGPDAFSSLTGAELIQQKVNRLYILGCKESGKPENNMFYVGEDYDNNRWYGTQAAGEAGAYIAKNWPTEIVFITTEQGGVFNTGFFFKKSDPAGNDILTRAMVDQGYADSGCWSFDTFAVLAAIADATGELNQYNIASKQGVMSINANGSSSWTDSSVGRHRKLQKNIADSYYANLIDTGLAHEFKKRSGKQVVW